MKRPTSLIAGLLTVLLFTGAGCATGGGPAASVVPVSGEWQLTLGEQGAQTSCFGTAGLLTTGATHVTADPGGLLMTWEVDQETLVFHRDQMAVPFETSVRFFPVVTETGLFPGSVWFELTPASPERMTGYLHWDNHQDCAGDYSLDLVLTSADPVAPAFTPYATTNGNWQMSLAGMMGTCTPSVATFSNLPAGTLLLEHPTDPATGAVVEDVFVMTNLGLTLHRLPSTNAWVSVDDAADPGAALDAAGNPLAAYANHPFTMQAELLATQNNRLQGTFYFTSDLCSTSVSVQLAR